MVKIKGLNKHKAFIKILVSLVTIGLCTFLCFFLKEGKPEEIYNPGDTVTISVDKPSEEIPSEWDVAPDLPKEILIPSIGVTGYIQLVGRDQDNRIAVPNNVHLAGWYINSVKPGEVGLSIMDGHRDGTSIGGIFKNIGRLKYEDEFEIEYGDGTIRHFRVIDVREVSTEDAYDLMYEQREDIEIQLNLVSCGGTYSKKERTYDNRIIVISEGY